MSSIFQSETCVWIINRESGFVSNYTRWHFFFFFFCKYHPCRVQPKHPQDKAKGQAIEHRRLHTPSAVGNAGSLSEIGYNETSEPHVQSICRNLWRSSGHGPYCSLILEQHGPPYIILQKASVQVISC